MGLEYRQDGKFLSDAILTLPSKDLAKVLGLLEEIDLMSLMNSYAKDFMSSSKENLNKKLETRYQELSKEPVGGLVLRIFGSLNQILEIKPRRYTGECDFEDNAAEIVSRTVAVLHSHEKFFTGQDLQALVRFQTVKLFEELGTKFENLSEEERHDLMAKIRRFVNELPIDQQQRLKEDLHAEELSDPVIKNAIKSGALGTSFAAAVAATSIVGSLTSVGVSLRFYGSLMSFMGVLSNPILLFMIFAGGGLWFYAKNNRTLRERLAPHVVSQLAVASLASKGSNDSQRATDEAIRLWSDARNIGDTCRSKLKELESQLEALSSLLNDVENKIIGLEDRKRELLTERDNKLQCLAERAQTIAPEISSGKWGATLTEHGRKLNEVLDKLREIEKMPSRDGILAAWDWTVRNFNAAVAKQDMEVGAKSLAEEARKIWISHPELFDEQEAKALRAMDETEVQLLEIETELENLERCTRDIEAKKTTLNQNWSELDNRRKQTEDRYLGVG